MWNIEEAIVLVRQLELDIAHLECHVALSGSVLLKGYSIKDLDIIIYPHNYKLAWELSNIKNFLNSRFGILTDCTKRTPEQDKEGDVIYRDDKDVSWVRLPDGRRIDFFFLK